MPIIPASWPKFRVFKLNYWLGEDLMINHHPKLTLFGLHSLLALAPGISHVSLCFCITRFPDAAILPEREEGSTVEIVVGGCGKNAAKASTQYGKEMGAKGYIARWGRSYGLLRLCTG